MTKHRKQKLGLFQDDLNLERFNDDIDFLTEFRTHEYFKMVIDKIHHPNKEQKELGQRAHQKLVFTVQQIEMKLEECSKECEKILDQLQTIKGNNSDDLKLSMQSALKKQQEKFLKYEKEYQSLSRHLEVAQKSLAKFSDALKALSAQMDRVTEHSTKIKSLLQSGLPQHYMKILQDKSEPSHEEDNHSRKRARR